MTFQRGTENGGDWVRNIEQPVERSIVQTAPVALQQLRTALSIGTPWQKAILEPIGMGTSVEETFGGRKYR